ncbi:MAG: hypothetical protein M3Z75_11560 [Actinomycetota bacterium]|nr:hypothetical protein [Actinomycetota bacterium]
MNTSPAASAPGLTARPAWLLRRLFPLLGAIGLIVLGMAGTIWGPRYYGKTAWALPDDLWGTLIAAQRLLHLNLGALYTAPTQLVSLPGSAVIGIPVVALIDVAGLPLRAPGALGAFPGTWLIIGPYQVAISAVALFAADAIAERLGATRPKRFLLAAASATALWSVTIRWGHPEDAVATGLLLYAILALSEARTSRSGWLAGAAVAVQPLVLLALPVLVMSLGPGRRLGLLARAAAPSVLLLAVAAIANWTATLHAVTSQPNSPVIDHPTPWIYLAPHLAGGQVAAGPARILAIAVACGCGLAAGRLRQAAGADTRWTMQMLQELLWWAAVALALRSVFEPVMVAYYLWPPLALALIVASSRWSRLLGAAIAAIALTFLAQIGWRNPWSWWLPMITILGLTLYLARGKRVKRPLTVTPAQVLPEPGEQFVADGAP